MAMPLSDELRRRVARLRSFVDDRLQVDLNLVVDRRRELQAKLAQVLELARNLRTIKEAGVAELKTRVNLGCDCFVQAVVPNASRVFVDVGLGFFAELTPEEALAHLAKREELLRRQIDTCNSRAALISAHIKFVTDGIGELMGVPVPGAAPRRRSDLL